MTSVFWGLLGAILIGVSDCIARVTAQRVSISVLVLVIMLLSLCALSLWNLFIGQMPPWHAGAWAASALSGALNLLALYLLYMALKRGPVAVASPTASVFTVILVMLNAAAGEPWSAWQLLAVAIVFAGVVMLTKRSSASGIDDDFDAAWIRKTAWLALGCACAIALRMFLAQEANAILGAMSALYLNRLFAVVSVVFVIVYQLSKQQQLMWPRGKILSLVMVQAVLETAALGAFLIGSAGNGRIASVVGFSAFAAVTALCASWWLGERIGWQRGLWISVVALGIVLAVLGSPSV